MQRIPIIGSIYGTSKQLVTLFEKKDSEKMQGMKAVFCFFGEKRGPELVALLVSPEKYRINGPTFISSSCPRPPCRSAADFFSFPWKWSSLLT